MPAFCDHQPTVECCGRCCRWCFLAEQLDTRLEDEQEHPLYGRPWPTYHRLVEKPAKRRPKVM